MRLQRSNDHMTWGPGRLRFVLVLTLLACAVPFRAQTLNSSRIQDSDTPTNSQGLLKANTKAGAFGAVNDAVSGQVDASVQGYSGAMGVDASPLYTAELTGSRHSGKKSSESLASLDASGSAASILSAEIQSTMSRGSHGSDGLMKQRNATPVFTGAAISGPDAEAENSSRMYPALPSDTQQEGAPSKDLAASESGIESRATSESGNGFEQFGDQLNATQGTDQLKGSRSASFEEPCSSGCGLQANFGVAKGRSVARSQEQVLTSNLSRSSNRLKVSGTALGEDSGKLFGNLGASMSRLRTGTSGRARPSADGGSTGPR